MFHTNTSTFLSYVFHQEAVPKMLKDTDSGFRTLDPVLPSCVNLSKSFILSALVSSSVQRVSWCWPLARGFISSPWEPFSRIAWVLSQVATGFPQSKWSRKVQGRSTRSFITWSQRSDNFISLRTYRFHRSVWDISHRVGNQEARNIVTTMEAC